MLIRTSTSSAICINQADLPERAQQVKIMCDIYRFAKKVLIYLGEDSDGLDRAVDLLNMIHEKAHEPISRRLGEHKTASQMRMELHPTYAEVWNRLHDLFNRP